LGHK